MVLYKFLEENRFN
jgi:hypothetical protein